MANVVRDFGAPDLSGVDWVARVKDLAPVIASAAPEIDAGRGFTPELVAALHASGLYRLLLPRSCGGAEVDAMTFAEVIGEIAAHDASTAWCIGQVTACSMSAAYLELDAAREIFGPADTVLAWGPPLPGATNRAVVVDGGYRVSGSWQFASGSRQATWMGAAVALFEDVWQVVGLRGTGSDRYTINDLFIPDRHTFSREGYGRREPSPLYRLSMVFMHAIAFAAVPLGIARATLESFVDLARHKRPTRGSFGKPLRENNAIQMHIGRAEARLRAAKAYLLASTRDAWAEASTLSEGEVGLERRIDMRAASTHAIGEAEKVVDICYRLAGANAIFDSQPFERRFRDLHTVTQQVQGHLSNYETIGQYRLDLPIDLSI
jgi:alkylation response protein AidB-like acyl-CoA dehydrogenase